MHVRVASPQLLHFKPNHLHFLSRWALWDVFFFFSLSMVWVQLWPKLCLYLYFVLTGRAGRAITPGRAVAVLPTRLCSALNYHFLLVPSTLRSPVSTVISAQGFFLIHHPVTAPLPLLSQFSCTSSWCFKRSCSCQGRFILEWFDHLYKSPGFVGIHSC